MALTKIPNNLITVDAIDGTLIADNAINSEHYTDGSIDLAHMSANSIDSDQYVDGSIDTVHIAADQITSALIADDQIDSEHYVDGSIDLAHMSANSIDSDQYVDGSIDAAHLAAAQTNITSLGTLTALTGGTGDLIWDTPTFVVDSSANKVGIGIASPDTTLHVSTSDRNMVKFHSSYGTARTYYFRNDSGVLNIGGGTPQDASDLLNLDVANMRVGIGTKTPSYVLHTKSSDSINTWLQSTHATDCKLQFSSATTDDYSRISAIAGVLKYEADIAGAVASSGHQWTVDGGEKMRIDSSGRLLVGQTSSSSPGNLGKLQVTGGIGLTGNSTIRNSTTSDDGSTIKFFGTQFVAGSNSQSYSYSEGGYLASIATAGSAILLDVGNTTANTGHRFRVSNAGNGIDGSIQYWDGTTSRFHVDSSTGIIKENDIPVRSRAIAMAMVFG